MTTNANMDVGGERDLSTTCGNVNGITTMEISWKFIKNLKLDLPHDSAVRLLGM